MRYETNLLTTPAIRKALRTANTNTLRYLRREANLIKRPRKATRFYLSLINYAAEKMAALTFCEKNYGAGLALPELRSLVTAEIARRS